MHVGEGFRALLRPSSPIQPGFGDSSSYSPQHPSSDCGASPKSEHAEKFVRGRAGISYPTHSWVVRCSRATVAESPPPAGSVLNCVLTTLGCCAATTDA